MCKGQKKLQDAGASMGRTKKKCFCDLSGQAIGAFTVTRRRFWGSSGCFCDLSGQAIGAFTVTGEPLGATGEPLGASGVVWGSLGYSWEALGRRWEALGRLLPVPAPRPVPVQVVLRLGQRTCLRLMCIWSVARTCCAACGRTWSSTQGTAEMWSRAASSQRTSSPEEGGVIPAHFVT